MRILLISLGCDKNLVDSEFMLGSLLDEGYELTDNEAEADIIIINSCCFINDAKMESIETILEMAEYKKTGSLKALIVCGCLAQRYEKEIRKEIPEVDAIVGTTAYEDIVTVIKQTLNEGMSSSMKDINYMPSQKGHRVFSTGTEYSYLKIAEGCDKRCTYCIIPYLRGSYRSVPMPELIAQAEYLADTGVKELIVVAQETTLYGTDIYGHNALPELLNNISKVEGIEWIRLLYAYPEDITDELIDIMASNPKICHYIDMPIQHASENILRRMGRKTNQKELEEKINMIRSRIPDIAIRTTLITGFPGETDEDHRILMDFVKRMRFDRLGVFPYSPEENTPAAEFPDQISDDIKQTRLDEIMKLQQNIAFEMAESKTGQCLDVIIEGELTSDNVYVARTMADAPKIDGCVFIPITERYMSGDIVRVEITGALDYDLLAVPAL